MELTPKILQTAKDTLYIPEQKLENPILIQMIGLPCWGKSHLAKHISEVAPIVVITADKIRKALFPETEHSVAETRFLNDEVIETIVKELGKKGHSVILDLNTDLKKYRKKNCLLATSLNMRCLTIVSKCSDRTAKLRLEQRRKNPWKISQTQEYIVPADAYDMYKKRIELPNLLEKHFTFNSEKPETKKFQKLINYLNHEPNS